MTECLKDYFKALIMSNSTQKIRCPEYQCMQPVSREEIEAICGELLFEKFLVVETNKNVMQDSLLKQCPYPDCNGVARIDYKF